MTLVDLRDGVHVFIDANIFIYHFGGRSLECKALLERCARRELFGYTSTPVLYACTGAHAPGDRQWRLRPGRRYDHLQTG